MGIDKLTLFGGSVVPAVRELNQQFGISVACE